MRSFHCTSIITLVGSSILAIGAMTIPTAALATPAGTVSAAPAPAPFGRISDLLDRLRKIVHKSKTEVDAGLTPASKQTVLDLLDDAEAEIDTLMDPQTDPTLVPSTAGDVLGEFQPVTLADLAADADWLADAAFDEAMLSNPSHYLIGSYVLTIEFWLDDYRQAVLDA